MRHQILVSTLFTLFTSILAAPSCTHIKIFGEDICMIDGIRPCADIFSKDDFKGDSILNSCAAQDECVQIPRGGPLYKKMNSFSKTGLAKADGDSSDTFMCAGYPEDNCQGEEGALGNYMNHVADFGNKMASYRCWVPVKW
jgi:hypothetical protein